MNDNQLNMLTAFLVALGQQKESLPDEVLTELRALSVNLSVSKLDDIASSYKPLSTPYEEAFNYLNNQAHQRKQGLDVIPDVTEENRNTGTNEVGNSASEYTTDIPTMLKYLDEKYGEKDKMIDGAKNTFAAPDPVAAARSIFLLPS